MKVRFHRGSLEDSMNTCFEPKNSDDFFYHCKNEDEYLQLHTIKCRLYMDDPDDRIGWDKTYIITGASMYDTGRGVIGFSDKDITPMLTKHI